MNRVEEEVVAAAVVACVGRVSACLGVMDAEAEDEALPMARAADAAAALPLNIDVAALIPVDMVY